MKKSEDKLSWVVKQYEEYKKDTEIQIGDLEDELFAWKSEYKKLKKENRNLNIKVARLEGEIKGLNSVIEKLKEENQTLELCLDNKEKVNKSLREELSAYDREYFDEDKKAKNIFMEEDTLQELRDLGKI